MRIAIVQAGLSAGGTERVVSLLADDRCGRHDEVHVFAFTGADEQSYFPFHSNVIVHRLVENEANPLRKIGLLRSLMRILMLRAEFRALRPDLVASFLTKINILSILATRGLGIPVIVSERNNPRIQEKHWLWRVASALVLRMADALVMQTEAIRRTLPAGLKEKAVVIGNPCDRRDAPGGGRPEALRIVGVGRLVGQKGFDVLIDAFARVAPEFPAWTLTIFGEGPDRRSLEQQVASLGLQERAELPGVTEQAGAWVDAASIFVLSSRYEGFPNVLVEAMAAGVPVIATDCDFGPSEIVAHDVSGLLTGVDDDAQLATSLRRLMADAPLRHEMAAAGQRAVARFSTHAVMAKWDACFQEVASRRSRASNADGFLSHLWRRTGRQRR